MIKHCYVCGHERSCDKISKQSNTLGVTYIVKCITCGEELKHTVQRKWAVIDYSKLNTVVFSVSDMPEEAFVKKGLNTKQEALQVAKKTPGHYISIDDYVEQ